MEKLWLFVPNIPNTSKDKAKFVCKYRRYNGVNLGYNHVLG